MSVEKCTFCRIISGLEPANIAYQDSEIAIFSNIHPAATHHFLAIPKTHIDNINHLNISHIPLIERMAQKATRVVEDSGGNIQDILLGFHKPPFNAIDHLHLHCISPMSEMSFLSRLIYRPNDLWFASVEQIVRKLLQM
ncbi:histidine triad nucleotide-binding protein 3-like [Coccinella septempunctata]|uniref:histidine triad nucleotide-binding protein 3-like n=1 Tax=Coccinella septempunctata TaxID=41139 RepID=UPI001D074170|nr:histidine triad nucleotide-binding protein 3-like [Coccinella septempunctata]